MTKQEYIRQLRTKLKGLDEKEIEDAITYCEEYFDDAGEGNEDQVIKDLGSPSKFAAQLKAESIIREEETGTKKKKHVFRNFWFVLIGLCAMPLAFPLLLVVGILVFCIFIIAITLLFALVVSAFAIVVTGLPLLANAFLHLNAPGNALIAAGGGFFCIGLALLLGSLAYCVMKKFLEWGTTIFSSLYRKAKGGKSHEKA